MERVKSLVQDREAAYIRTFEGDSCGAKHTGRTV